MREEQWKRLGSNLLLVFLLGIPGFGIALGDLGKGRTILDWIFLVVAYFLFAGFLLGLFDVKYWYLAGLIPWGPLLIDGLILIFGIGEQPIQPVGILVPLFTAAFGGFLGAVARARIGAR